MKPKRLLKLVVPTGDWLSPKGFILRAAVCVAALAVVHLLGWREYTSIISGTSPTGESISLSTALPGMLYMAAWFATVLIAPALLIAAGVLRLARRRNENNTRIKDLG